MSNSKETHLTIAVILYAMRCVTEGDQQALRRLNLGPKELEALMQLKMGDLCGTDALGVSCLNIGLNRQVFWPMLEHLRYQRESVELQRKLLAADAPLEMMQYFFGISAREYGRRRKILTLAPSIGRPRELSETETHALWYAWRDLIQDDGRQTLPPEEIFDLHRRTGINLRSLWTQLQRWEAYGEGLSGVLPARDREHVQ